MSAPELVLARTEGGVAWLTLNRPEKRNALSPELVAALTAALKRAEEDAAVRVVALEGAGKDFCAGADLAALERLAAGPIADSLDDAQALGEIFLAIRGMGKPVVAVVRGRALAGGCGLASACDLVLAAESAEFGYPEVSIGFVPAMVMAILRRNLGEKRAFELVAVAERISAEAAAGMGLVNRVYADGEFERQATEFLRQLAARSATALALSKRLLYRQDGVGFEEGIRAGAGVNALARLTDDAREGIGRFNRSGSGEG